MLKAAHEQTLDWSVEASIDIETPGLAFTLSLSLKAKQAARTRVVWAG